jgi:hypothetical protein
MTEKGPTMRFTLEPLTDKTVPCDCKCSGRHATAHLEIENATFMSEHRTHVVWDVCDSCADTIVLQMIKNMTNFIS